MERADQTDRRIITAPEAWEWLGIPKGTIRGWASPQRGKPARLHAVSIDANGERWYLLSDVLALRETTRRRTPHTRPNRQRAA